MPPPSLRPSLLVSFYDLVRPSLASVDVALLIAKALSSLGQIGRAWDIQRGFNAGGEREAVLVGLLEAAFGAAGLAPPDYDDSDLEPKPHAASLSTLLHTPFDAFEDSLLASFSLELPPSLAPASRSLLRHFHLSRLVSESRYVEAVRFEREVSKLGQADDKMVKVVKGLKQVLPEVQREVIELEEAESSAGMGIAPVPQTNGGGPAASGMMGSWSLIGTPHRPGTGTPSQPSPSLPATAFLRPGFGSPAAASSPAAKGSPAAGTNLTPGQTLLKALALQRAERAKAEQQQQAQSNGTPEVGGDGAADVSMSSIGTPSKVHGSNVPFIGPPRLPSSAQRALPASVASPVRRSVSTTLPFGGDAKGKQPASAVAGQASTKHFGSPFGQSPAVGLPQQTSTNSIPSLGSRNRIVSGGKLSTPRSQYQRRRSSTLPRDEDEEVDEEDEESDDPLLLRPADERPTRKAGFGRSGPANAKSKREADRFPEPPFSDNGDVVSSKRRTVHALPKMPRAAAAGAPAPSTSARRSERELSVPGAFGDEDQMADVDTTVVGGAEPEMRESRRGRSGVVAGLGQSGVEDDEAAEQRDAFPASPPPPTPASKAKGRSGRRVGSTRRSESVASIASSVGAGADDDDGASITAQTPRRSSRLRSTTPSVTGGAAGSSVAGGSDDEVAESARKAKTATRRRTAKKA